MRGAPPIFVSDRSITFYLHGSMVSGKNQQQIGRAANGRLFKYPNQRFVSWRNTMLGQIIEQKRSLRILFSEPVFFSVDYWPADNIHRDLPGIMDAVFHLMEKAGVVADDNLFKSCLRWVRHETDKKDPRLVFSITPESEYIFDKP